MYSMHYTLGSNTNVKKFPSDKISGTKNAPFSGGELQLITGLLLICDSYMS